MKVNLHTILFRRALIAVGLAALVALGMAAPALAHTRVEAGPYIFIVGWEKEPVIVGERNALRIEITENEAPVTGVEGSLEVTVFYGGQSYIGQLAPSSEEGVYLAEIFPTVRGQYELQVIGEIDGNPVDFFVEPEEVLRADILQFPETQPDPGVMQADIEALKSALESARALALIGLGVGAAGLLAGGAALWIAAKMKRGAEID